MLQKNPEITFKYIFTYDYNPVYVNGAHGGVSSRGELVVNFYMERPPLPNEITNELNPNGTIGGTIAVDPADFNNSIVRFVPTGVVLNLQSAQDLHQWMGEKIKEMTLLEQAKASMQAGDLGNEQVVSH